MTHANPNTPLILDIKGNSLDDGPGIRSVVFFKGCPLSCVWCHNPESKKPGPEISFDKNECVDCGTCMDVCPENTLDRDNVFFIVREKCTLCGLCAENCPSGALSMVGRTMEIKEIVQTVAKDRPFFKNSGGGVTLSGGEPTLYMDFLSDLLKQLKADRIHTLLETCGLFECESFEKKVLPYIDTIYYDIKIIDPNTHRQFCGVKNDRILENFIRLHRLCPDTGVELLARTPLIPDITATEKNLTAIADFLNDQGIAHARLLAYNPLWHEKNEKIGTADTFKNNKDMREWISKKKIETFHSIFRERGINTG